MTLPASFQLSFDLSNIIGPVTRTVLRFGSLAVLHDINRSGSDGITELRLAALLGRHRIADYLKENFKSIVADSRQSIISRVLREEQLALEVGSGPTVQQAITNPNPAWLSMVIQMSLLAFSQEQQSLAQAITTVSCKLSRGGAVDTRQELDYVSVLGAITACQQQTAQFPWTGFFERTEDKIFKDVQNGQHRKRYRKRRRLNNATQQENLACVFERSLPFVILQTLVMNLVSIQDFPEHRNLHLRTYSGSSTIIVWCYYVLGIGVNVQINGVGMQFGDNPRIFLENCQPFEASATLLDAAGENEPLFKLSQVEEDPPIQGEDRTTARGFIRRILMLSGVSEKNVEAQAHSIAAHCIRLLSSTAQPSVLASLKVTSMASQVERNLLGAVAFLFDIAELDRCLVSELLGKIQQKKEKLKSGDRHKWSQMILIIISFARVHNLEKCDNLPLSLKAYWGLCEEDFEISCQEEGFVGTAPDTFVCFDIISRMLLGHQYSKEYVASSALVSSWGWSVFFDSFDALDPADINPGVIHIRLGVPTRNGERKMRIVDGPTDVPIAWGEVLHESEIPITFWPGVFTGRLTATLIGYHGTDAFSAVQVYEWETGPQKSKKWRMGFRDKQEMCLTFNIIDICPCPEFLKDEESKAWINQLITTGHLQKRGVLDSARLAEVVEVTRKYPSSAEKLASSPERVFCETLRRLDTTDSLSSAWYFFVTANTAARWLALDGLEQLKGEAAGFLNILRGKGCCVKCACSAVATKSFVLL